MHNPTDRTVNTKAFVKPVMEHWLEQEIAQWVDHEVSIPDNPSHHERTLLVLPHCGDGSKKGQNVSCTCLVWPTNLQPVPGSGSTVECNPKLSEAAGTANANTTKLCPTPTCANKNKHDGKGNVLFNNTLNIFYLRLYGVRHMLKDHSDSERGNPLPPHGLLFSIDSKGSFICTIPQTG